MRRSPGRCSPGCIFAAGRAVKFVELPLDRRRLFSQFVYRAAGVAGFAAQKFDITLLGGLNEGLFPLFGRHCILQSVAFGRSHVVHAYGSDRLQPRIDLRRTDGKTAAAADAYRTDAFPVDELPRSEKIDRRAEILRINVRQDGVARFPVAVAPEREVDGQRHETLFGQLRGIQVGALLLDGSHRMAHDDCRTLLARLHIPGQEEVCTHLHLIQVRERDFFHIHLIALIKVVRIGLCGRNTVYHKQDCR